MAKFQSFEDMLNIRRKRMDRISEAQKAHPLGLLKATSARDPEYSICLTKGLGDAAWRVTSFRDGIPIGHRDYDRLEGGAPAFNALSEFISSDWIIP